ncbi:hypothetical protein [Nocardia sp. NPDC048505]|uniref:hypothetical protein n=1 Tax=unclassified Nocardia TaxID=2637762 RepID=UPI0033CD3849
MPTPPTLESGPKTSVAHATTTACGASILVALLGPVAPGDTAFGCEPRLPGLYLDRDGDIWHRSDAGWRLCRQRGAAVEDASIWEWLDGHVRDYAPFVLITTE